VGGTVYREFVVLTVLAVLVVAPVFDVSARPGLGGLAMASVKAADVVRMTGTVPVGAKPDAIAVDPGTHSVYVANLADNTVSVFGEPVGPVVATVSVGRAPVAIAVDELTHRIYVANSADQTVSVLDGRTNTVTNTVHLAHEPRRIAVDSTSHLVAVATTYIDATYGVSFSEIETIDGMSDKVVSSIPIGGSIEERVNKGVAGLAVDPTTHWLYLTSDYKYYGYLFIIDPTSRQPITGSLSGPLIYDITYGITFDQATGQLIAALETV
jgi:YVTN family beta-propeller protein